MRDLQIFAIGVTAYGMTLLSLGTAWQWPCVIVGGLIGGWCSGELWFGRR